jgi:hypothetical protein
LPEYVPSNRSREVFIERVVPQLGYNSGAFRKTLATESVPLCAGAVQYKGDAARFDKFVDALSYGIVFKACGACLPAHYRTGHVYHNFFSQNETAGEQAMKAALLSLYSRKPMAAFDFGSVNALNTSVYSVKLFGIRGFLSSITIVHDFFGVFRVTSMLSK